MRKLLLILAQIAICVAVVVIVQGQSDPVVGGTPVTGCASTGVSRAQVLGGQGIQFDSLGDQCNAGPVLQVGTTASSNTAITMTPTSGEFVHVVAITVDNCAGSAAVTAANPTSITSSGGLGITIMVGSGVTAGLCQPVSQLMLGPSAVRSTVSGAQTITTPTFVANQTVRVSVYWYSAP